MNCITLLVKAVYINNVNFAYANMYVDGLSDVELSLTKIIPIISLK
jgi:hypothetical protein